MGKIGDVINALLPQLLDKLVQFMPDMLNLIMSILNAIGKTIINNLPIKINAATEIVIALLNELCTE